MPDWEIVSNFFKGPFLPWSCNSCMMEESAKTSPLHVDIDFHSDIGMTTAPPKEWHAELIEHTSRESLDYVYGFVGQIKENLRRCLIDMVENDMLEGRWAYISRAPYDYVAFSSLADVTTMRLIVPHYEFFRCIPK